MCVCVRGKRHPPTFHTTAKGKLVACVVINLTFVLRQVDTMSLTTQLHRVNLLIPQNTASAYLSLSVIFFFLPNKEFFKIQFSTLKLITFNPTKIVEHFNSKHQNYIFVVVFFFFSFLRRHKNLAPATPSFTMLVLEYC